MCLDCHNGLLIAPVSSRALPQPQLHEASRQKVQTRQVLPDPVPPSCLSAPSSPGLRTPAVWASFRFHEHAASSLTLPSLSNRLFSFSGTLSSCPLSASCLLVLQIVAFILFPPTNLPGATRLGQVTIVMWSSYLVSGLLSSTKSLPMPTRLYTHWSCGLLFCYSSPHLTSCGLNNHTRLPNGT